MKTSDLTLFTTCGASHWQLHGPVWSSVRMVGSGNTHKLTWIFHCAEIKIVLAFPYYATIIVHCFCSLFMFSHEISFMPSLLGCGNFIFSCCLIRPDPFILWITREQHRPVSNRSLATWKTHIQLLLQKFSKVSPSCLRYRTPLNVLMKNINSQLPVS